MGVSGDVSASFRLARQSDKVKEGILLSSLRVLLKQNIATPLVHG
jgi:hypothetical protein